MERSILKDLAILYEISLSFGNSLDLKEEAKKFFSRLITRTSFEYGSLWVLNENNYELIYAYPMHHILIEKVGIEEVNSIFKENDLVIVPSDKFVWEEGLSEGYFVFVRSGKDIFIKLFISSVNDVNRYAEKFKEVLKKFGNFIKGAKSHEELLNILKELQKERNYRIKRAYIDPLTELPNRAYFLKKLANAIKTHEEVAVGIIDLDNFKWINDTFGHITGDKVLKVFAKKLRERFSDGFVARIAGDEFAFICWGKNLKERVSEQLKQLIEDFRNPVNVDGLKLQLSFSTGIEITHGNASVSEILRRADIALYRSKDTGKGRYIFFSKHLKESLGIPLLKNIHSDIFNVVFQPIYDIHTLKILGVEALIRVRTEGVSIEEVINFLEKTGLIYLADRFSIENSIKLFRDKDLKVHVNVSDLHLRKADFLDWLSKTIKKYSFNPENLVIELTERRPLNFEADIETIRNICKLGSCISIDDFGEGYTSISYLQKIPARYVKIDKGLVWKIGKDANAIRVIQAIINTCRIFNLKVVAEGVEEKEQLEILRDIGCDMVQGYLLSKPRKYEELVDII